MVHMIRKRYSTVLKRIGWIRELRSEITRLPNPEDICRELNAIVKKVNWVIVMGR